MNFLSTTNRIRIKHPGEKNGPGKGPMGSQVCQHLEFVHPMNGLTRWVLNDWQRSLNRVSLSQSKQLWEFRNHGIGKLWFLIGQAGKKRVSYCTQALSLDCCGMHWESILPLCPWFTLLCKGQEERSHSPGVTEDWVVWWESIILTYLAYNTHARNTLNKGVLMRNVE